MQLEYLPISPIAHHGLPRLSPPPLPVEAAHEVPVVVDVVAEGGLVRVHAREEVQGEALGGLAEGGEGVPQPLNPFTTNSQTLPLPLLPTPITIRVAVATPLNIPTDALRQACQDCDQDEDDEGGWGGVCFDCGRGSDGG